MRKTLIVIVGPTAVGKTNTSVQLASRLNCAIVNADSRQVFKELSIGTAKPSIKEMADIQHYFVDDRSILEDFSAGKFEREALEIIKKELTANDFCILSGGSGLYIDAVCYGLNRFPEVDKSVRERLMDRLSTEGTKELYAELVLLDPEYAAQIEPQNSQRIVRALEIFKSSGTKYSSLRTGMKSFRDFDIIFLGLNRPREELYARINSRMDQMIENGLFEEVKSLSKYRDKNALQTVGYNEVFLYFDDKVDRTEAIRLLKRNSRRYSKRQMTWFNRNPETEWFHPEEIDKIEAYLKKRLQA